MRKVSFVFFGLAFAIAVYTYGVPFLSRSQVPSCPTPTPVSGKNTYPSEWSEEQKDTVREAIRCLLPLYKSYQAKAMRRRGSPETEAILLALQNNSNSEWKKSFESSLERGEKPPYPPMAAFSREEFDSAYEFTNCFYQCIRFEMDITAHYLKTGQVEISSSKVFPSIVIDLSTFSVLTPVGELDSSTMTAGNDGVSWRIDDYNYPDLPVGSEMAIKELLAGTRGATVEVSLREVEIEDQRQKFLSLYIRSIDEGYSFFHVSALY